MISGLIIGRISTKYWIGKIITNVGFGRTPNSNIWADVLRDGCWLRFYFEDGSSYLGQYRYCETHKSEPIVGVGKYVYLKDGEILENHMDDLDGEWLMMIRTSECQSIQIQYPTGKEVIHVVPEDEVK